VAKQQTTSGWDVVLDLGDPSSGPLNQRVKRALRTAIRAGRIPAGAALPPSRTLADDLGCSRWTVTEAYAQLAAEGYLEGQAGSATRVRWSESELPTAETLRPKERAENIMDLAPGLPDLRHFPYAHWAAALRGAITNLPAADLAYPAGAGHQQLRRVLGSYLERGRGASRRGATLQVTTGATSGAARICTALQTIGIHEIAVEDPGWSRLHAAVRATGMNVRPIPVDQDGLRIDALDRSPARAVIVTPAHHFPYGVVLNPQRRTALLGWANRNNGVILEDDYDAEFRYDRAPVSTIQGMDPSCVVLLGSLSKTLSPALRIGWMIMPQRIADALTEREQFLAVPPTVDQIALADLIESGRYDRHLRAARRRYRARRDALVASLTARLQQCQLDGIAAGLHLILRLPPATSAAAVIDAGRAKRLKLTPLSAYCEAANPLADSALVLGYGNLADGEVATASSRLRSAVRAAAGTS
jgi:GntR family transcriptional regulator/MocR family aminotransferase